MRYLKYIISILHHSYLVSVLLLIPYITNAQYKTNDNLYPKQLTQIYGIYDTQKKTFYSQFIDKQNIKIIHRFQTKKFIDGLGITEYYNTNSDTHYESNKSYGLIDTTGNILIPCIYEHIITTRNNLFYGFHTKDSLGIINIKKGEIFKYPKINSKPINNTVRSKVNSFISTNNSINCCILRINGSMGVYSYYQENFVVPTKYDKITLYGKIAVCETLSNFVVYNCENGNKSDLFRQVFLLNEGKYFFVRLMNRTAIVCSDPISPTNSIYTELPIDEALEFNNNHLIANKAGKLGLINEFGKECVPFIYDDIYFFDRELLLVKKDDLWAISDYQNKLLTQFQFINVDKQNQVNLNNFILFSGIDTTDKVIMKYFDYESGYGKFNEYLLAEIKKSLITIKSELYSRKLSKYDDWVYPSYVLRSTKGFQLIKVISKEKLKIDSLYWDNVYMIPRCYDYPFEIGVQKGNKFGYYSSEKSIKKYLKYEGVYFYYKLFFYQSILYSGTHSERSPFTFVKKGYVFIRSSYPKTNWLKRITTPPNWPSNYQGKPKWSKYMKENEFLKIRSETS